MIKGVNKQIVEINYTKDDYIEKAILIMNPNKAGASRAELSRHAEAYMQHLLGEKTPPSKGRRRMTLWLGLAILLFGGLLALCFLL